MGGTAFVTAGSKDKIDSAIKLGAKAGYVDIIYTHSPTHTHTHTTHRWNYKTEDWGKAMEGKANVILDCVGGSHAPRNVQSLAMDSRWVLFGLMGGRDAPGEGKGLLGFAAEVMPFFVKGKLKVVIDSKFNFDKIKDAYDRLLANKNIGKILVVGINGSS